MNTQNIILANGSFPKSEAILQLLDNAKQIICCDGAVNKLLKSGREPSIIIGDLDSVADQIKEQYKNKLIHIKEQETNDLTKAINWCVSQNIKDIIIVGATGEREDHTLANIALLSVYKELLNTEMVTDNGRFIPINKTTTFKASKGQQVSIFTQNPSLEVSSTGLKYPLQNLKLNNWWMGTLNEVIDNKFTISFHEKESVIIYISKL